MHKQTLEQWQAIGSARLDLCFVMTAAADACGFAVDVYLVVSGTRAYTSQKDSLLGIQRRYEYVRPGIGAKSTGMASTSTS